MSDHTDRDNMCRAMNWLWRWVVVHENPTTYSTFNPVMSNAMAEWYRSNKDRVGLSIIDRDITPGDRNTIL